MELLLEHPKIRTLNLDANPRCRGSHCKGQGWMLSIGALRGQVSYSLNSLKGGYIGDYIGTTIGLIKGDTRSLDYSSSGSHTSVMGWLIDILLMLHVLLLLRQTVRLLRHWATQSHGLCGR